MDIFVWNLYFLLVVKLLLFIKSVKGLRGRSKKGGGGGDRKERKRGKSVPYPRSPTPFLFPFLLLPYPFRRRSLLHRLLSTVFHVFTYHSVARIWSICFVFFSSENTWFHSFLSRLWVFIDYYYSILDFHQCIVPPIGIICGPRRGSFTVEDHLRSFLGIICGTLQLPWLDGKASRPGSFVQRTSVQKISLSLSKLKSKLANLLLQVVTWQCSLRLSCTSFISSLLC